MVGETWENWKDNVRRALELSPESLTIYQMELPFNTVFSKDVLTGTQKETPVADWPTKRAWVSYAFDEFLSAGYSISSAYTLVKDPKKVNFSYRDNLWDGADLLATGIASFGHASGVHYQNLPEWNDYLGAILDEGRLPLGRAYRPTAHQMLVRELILKLKTGKLDRQAFLDRHGVDIVARWEEVWNEYQERQWVEIDDHQVRLTREGMLRADGLLPGFFEPQFQGVRYT
jgi:oxygen-independent coproporphyrinogen-3 oxidase